MSREWARTGDYALSMSLMFFFQFISLPGIHLVSVLEKQELQLFADLLGSAMIVGSFSLATLMGFDDLDAVKIYSAAMSMYYLTLLALCFWILPAPGKRVEV